MSPCSYAWLEGRRQSGIVQGGDGVFQVWEAHFPCSSLRQVILTETGEVFSSPPILRETIKGAKFKPRSGN